MDERIRQGELSSSMFGWGLKWDFWIGNYGVLPQNISLPKGVQLMNYLSRLVIFENDQTGSGGTTSSASLYDRPKEVDVIVVNISGGTLQGAHLSR